jgi:hypothetical protein
MRPSVRFCSGETHSEIKVRLLKLGGSVERQGTSPKERIKVEEKEEEEKCFGGERWTRQTIFMYGKNSFLKETEPLYNRCSRQPNQFMAL